jgi:hypothetical protein
LRTTHCRAYECTGSGDSGRKPHHCPRQPDLRIAQCRYRGAREQPGSDRFQRRLARRATCRQPGSADRRRTVPIGACRERESTCSDGGRGQCVVASLNDSQRSQGVFEFSDSATKAQWSNLPRQLFQWAGVRMGDMTAEQRQLVKNLLQASLSQQGTTA